MLKNFVAIYVPSTNGGKKITRRIHNVFVKEIALQFSNQFGGCTTTKGIGYWPGKSGLITESVTIVRSYYDIDSTVALSLANVLASYIKTKLNQEAVSIETESGLDFI